MHQMNPTGRRIAILAASLVFAASSAGMLLTAVMAQEAPEAQTSAADAESSKEPIASDSDSTQSAPATSDPDGAESTPAETTQPAIPQKTTSDTDITDPNPSSSEPFATGTLTTVDPAQTTFPDPTQAQTTGTDIQTTTAKATKAPSKDPVLSLGGAASQGPIPLSTDKEGTVTVYMSGERPDRPIGSPEDPTVPGTPGDLVGESNPDSSTEQEAGIQKVMVLCSLFTALSGAVLVMLKFIR